MLENFKCHNTYKGVSHCSNGNSKSHILHMPLICRTSSLTQKMSFEYSENGFIYSVRFSAEKEKPLNNCNFRVYNVLDSFSKRLENTVHLERKPQLSEQKKSNMIYL